MTYDCGVHRSLLVWLFAAGCDYALRLDHLDEPTDDAAAVCVEIGHDEDNDGLDDACDPCPFDINNEGDADNDGIALMCDPDPTAPNQVLLFDGFGRVNPALFQAGGAIANDTWTPPDDITTAVMWPGRADPVWVVAGVDVTALPTASYRELGFVFDATPGNEAVDGTYCVLGRASEDYMQVFIRDRPDSDMDVLTQQATAPLMALRSGIMRGRHGRMVGPGSSCAFLNNVGGQTQISAVRTPLPAQGGVAIVSSHVEATFTFMFVVGPG
jgi:hypothetical protein